LIWAIAVRTAKERLGTVFERRERWDRVFGCTSNRADDLCDDWPTAGQLRSLNRTGRKSQAKRIAAARRVTTFDRLGGGRLSENISLAERYAAEFDKRHFIQFGDALVRPGLEIVDLAINRKALRRA